MAITLRRPITMNVGIWFLVAFLILLLGIGVLAAGRILMFAAMAFASWFRSQDEPPATVLLDPVFGNVTCRAGDDQWTGTCRFSPAQSTILVFLEAGPGGPTDDQRSLFREIENRFPDFEREFQNRIARLAEEWISGAKPDFEIVTIRVQGGKDARWMIDFATDVDDDLSFCISIANWQIEDAFVE